MISECLDRKKSFGVVRAKEEGVAEIGCTAEIITVAKKYPDGRMDIVTEGRERFEVMQVNQERSFLQAEVLYLQDEPDKATRRANRPGGEAARRDHRTGGFRFSESFGDRGPTTLISVWSDRFPWISISNRPCWA